MSDRRRYLRPGEMVAMDPRCLHSDRGAFFWWMSDPPKANERIGSTSIVHIRGELDHHETWCGDSYEGILCRYESAITGRDVVEMHAREHRWDADYTPLSEQAPDAVVLCVDSPGGVVSGLNETVRAIQQLKKQSGIRTIAYVNEMSASAAYALSCAADAIYCPESAIVGSIGVISTMISQARKNKEDGYDVRLLTSGARKSDGHLHAPITSDAVAAEMDRVNKLARAFFALAGDSRGLTPEKLRSYQAAIYLGPDAVKRGLADRVMSWDQLLTTASTPAKKSRSAGGNKTDRRVAQVASLTSQAVPGTSKGKGIMSILDELITKAQAQVDAATASRDPKNIVASVTRLTALQAAKKASEDDDEDEEDDDEEKKAKALGAAAAAKKAEEEEKKSKKAYKKGTEDEDEDEEEEAKAALALVRELGGVGAVRSMASLANETAQRVANLEKDGKAREKSSLIAEGRGKYLTKSDAAYLETQPLSVVKGFVEHRKATGVIVHTDEESLVKPKATAKPGTEESLPEDTINVINEAVAAFPGNAEAKAKFRADLVVANLKSHNEAVANALNGVGRY